MEGLGVYMVVGMVAACIGSMLNVLIYRIPRRLDVVFGRSACTQCAHVLGVIDLVPIVSYCVLLGKCRHCRKPISIRYLLVELICVAVAIGVLAIR